MARLNTHMHPLLNDSIIAALSSKNINTTQHFVEAKIKNIVLITGLSYKDAVNVRKHLINKESAVINDGLAYYQRLLQKTALISTGIENVDKILKGGLVTGNIYEICGLPANGKTQFSLTLAKNVVKTLDQHVYYIDTKGDFSGRKIKNMLEAEQLPMDKIATIMTKIWIKQINTKYELINCLYNIKTEMCTGLPLRLVIIDSLPPLFYQTTNHFKNCAVINHLANIMYLLSKEYHIVFVVTNTITTWYEGDSTVTEKLGLGKYWSSIPNTRMIIKKQNTTNNQFEFLISSSNVCKENYCIINIGEKGLY